MSTTVDHGVDTINEAAVVLMVVTIQDHIMTETIGIHRPRAIAVIMTTRTIVPGMKLTGTGLVLTTLRMKYFLIPTYRQPR